MAASLRRIPAQVAQVVVDLPPERLRHRPAPGEWSAIEVVGHLVDKLNRWGGRAAAVLRAEGPTLESYDQDECIRQGAYQSVDLDVVLGQLVQAAERFARMLEPLTEFELQRRARHAEYGTSPSSSALPCRSSRWPTICVKQRPRPRLASREPVAELRRTVVRVG